MQATKDTLFRTLQTRLAAVNPARAIVVDGATRPAVIVAENEVYPPPKLFFNTFYIHWLGAPRVRSFSATLAPRYLLLAQLEYFLQGSAQLQRPFADRGRLMGQMDRELIEILFPGFAQKTDYSGATPLPLGSQIHWSWTPDFRTVVDGGGSILKRVATVNVSTYLQDIPN
jgi:hypothetical protein